jgi:hypothetical protein
MSPAPHHLTSQLPQHLIYALLKVLQFLQILMAETYSIRKRYKKHNYGVIHNLQIPNLISRKITYIITFYDTYSSLYVISIIVFMWAG